MRYDMRPAFRWDNNSLMSIPLFLSAPGFSIISMTFWAKSLARLSSVILLGISILFAFRYILVFSSLSIYSVNTTAQCIELIVRPSRANRIALSCEPLFIRGTNMLPRSPNPMLLRILYLSSAGPFITRLAKSMNSWSTIFLTIASSRASSIIWPVCIWLKPSSGWNFDLLLSMSKAILSIFDRLSGLESRNILPVSGEPLMPLLSLTWIKDSAIALIASS